LLNDKINLEGNLKMLFREKDIIYKSFPVLKIRQLCVYNDFRKMGFKLLKERNKRTIPMYLDLNIS